MRLKILLLSHSFYPNIGGIENISEALAYAFVKEGHEVRVLTWSTDKSNKFFPFQVIRNPGKLTLLKQLNWPDVVLENNPCLRLSWPLFFIKRPHVVGLQTWLTKVSGSVGWQERLKQKALSRAQKVVACSKIIQEKCWPEAMIISNPFQKDQFRRLANISKTKEFVFLGRLVSDKGADLAIKAFAQLLTSFQNNSNVPLSLTVVGDGPERSNLKQMVSDLNINKHVVFTGALRDEALVECLNEHRFLLVPSLWQEPFGIVALEGMACGCIPIVSDGGGLPEAVGNAGLVFQRGDASSLMERMKEILVHTKLEELLRNEAQDHLANFEHNVIARQYLLALSNAKSKFQLRS